MKKLIKIPLLIMITPFYWFFALSWCFFGWLFDDEDCWRIVCEIYAEDFLGRK